MYHDSTRPMPLLRICARVRIECYRGIDLTRPEQVSARGIRNRREVTWSLATPLR